MKATMHLFVSDISYKVNRSPYYHNSDNKESGRWNFLFCTKRVRPFYCIGQLWKDKVPYKSSIEWKYILPNKQIEKQSYTKDIIYLICSTIIRCLHDFSKFFFNILEKEVKEKLSGKNFSTWQGKISIVKWRCLKKVKWIYSITYIRID